MKKHLLRHPNITVFAFGEAETEKAFLKHIRATYGRNTGIRVTVNSANGSDPSIIVNLAIKISRLSFNRHFILLDTDRTWTRKVINKAKANNIELIPATPCIEGFLLLLLEQNIDISVLTSSQCKKTFEKKYLKKDEKLDHRNYTKILPLNKLETLRKTNKQLDRIICLMTKRKRVKING